MCQLFWELIFYQELKSSLPDKSWHYSCYNLENRKRQWGDPCVLSAWPSSSPHLLPEEIVILPRKNSFLLWKNQVKVYKDWIKLLTNNVLVDYHFGPYLASIPKQNVFIDVFKQFGVTASGINNAIDTLLTSTKPGCNPNSIPILGRPKR